MTVLVLDPTGGDVEVLPVVVSVHTRRHLLTTPRTLDSSPGFCRVSLTLVKGA